MSAALQDISNNVPQTPFKGKNRPPALTLGQLQVAPTPPNAATARMPPPAPVAPRKPTTNASGIALPFYRNPSIDSDGMVGLRRTSSDCGMIPPRRRQASFGLPQQGVPYSPSMGSVQRLLSFSGALPYSSSCTGFDFARSTSFNAEDVITPRNMVTPRNAGTPSGAWANPDYVLGAPRKQPHSFSLDGTSLPFNLDTPQLSRIPSGTWSPIPTATPATSSFLWTELAQLYPQSPRGYTS